MNNVISQTNQSGHGIEVETLAIKDNQGNGIKQHNGECRWMRRSFSKPRRPVWSFTVRIINRWHTCRLCFNYANNQWVSRFRLGSRAIVLNLFRCSAYRRRNRPRS